MSVKFLLWGGGVGGGGVPILFLWARGFSKEKRRAQILLVEVWAPEKTFGPQPPPPHTHCAPSWAQMVVMPVLRAKVGQV